MMSDKGKPIMHTSSGRQTTTLSAAEQVVEWKRENSMAQGKG